MQVGNAYVNRHITGAIVRRQPFGGWKASVVGPGAKAGGPDYVAQLGTWVETDLPVLGAEAAGAMSSALNDFQSLVAEPTERDWLLAAARSDALVWDTVLSQPVDPSGLAAEANVLRRLPAPLTIRGLTGARAVDVFRVALAALRVGTPVAVSLAPSTDWADRLRGNHWLPDLIMEDDQQFAERFTAERVRIIGPDAQAVADALSAPGRMTLGGPVLANGRRELLSVVREQAISRTQHRYGHLPPTATQ